MTNESALPPPDQAALHQAALAYLARYASTAAGLRRVLQRRLDRWLREQPDREAAEPVMAAGKLAIEAVVAALTQSGLLSDAGFAEVRARSLVRAGRSRRVIQATLVSKGVAVELARDAVGEDAGEELAAALVLVRKRRLGAFRTKVAEDAAAARRREMGVLARAGFGRDVVERALDMDAEEAERLILELRAG